MQKSRSFLNITCEITLRNRFKVLTCVSLFVLLKEESSRNYSLNRRSRVCDLSIVIMILCDEILHTFTKKRAAQRRLTGVILSTFESELGRFSIKGGREHNRWLLTPSWIREKIPPRNAKYQDFAYYRRCELKGLYCRWVSGKKNGLQGHQGNALI